MKRWDYIRGNGLLPNVEKLNQPRFNGAAHVIHGNKLRLECVKLEAKK